MKTVYDPGLVHYDVTGGLWFWFDLLQMDYKNAYGEMKLWALWCAAFNANNLPYIFICYQIRQQPVVCVIHSDY